MKRRRVLMLVRNDHVPPESIEGMSDKEIKPFKAEFDVAEGLSELGHAVTILGVEDRVECIGDAVRELRPHVVFNLLEEFARDPAFVPHLLGYLELLGQAYTGCNPVGMMFSNDKARQRWVLRQHRVRVPGFFVVPWGRAVKRPKRLEFPLIVKSLTSHGSTGIAQASVVYDDDSLAERVVRVHEGVGTDAIVEQFVDGREIYVGVLGNERLETFCPWELAMENLPEGAPFVATEKVKWDVGYQERVGLVTGPARLDDALAERLAHDAKRAYRALEQSGYARMDFRVSGDGRAYLIESNPNPDLSFGEDFAKSAEHDGLGYPELLGRIVSLGERWRRRRR